MVAKLKSETLNDIVLIIVTYTAHDVINFFNLNSAVYS